MYTEKDWVGVGFMEKKKKKRERPQSVAKEARRHPVDSTCSSPMITIGKK